MESPQLASLRTTLLATMRSKSATYCGPSTARRSKLPETSWELCTTVVSMSFDVTRSNVPDSPSCSG